MKVAHLSVSDHAGGAARAAGQVHRAALAAGVESRMFVSDSPTLPESVSFATRIDRILQRLNIDGRFGFLAPRDSVFRSVALIPTGAERAVRMWNPDIIHLHWIGRRTASIAQVGRLMRDYPVVWSFHDMWPFSGAEHYTDEEPAARWRKRNGYNRNPLFPTDIDRWVFKRKTKHWPKTGDIVVPNPWLQGLAKDSVLMNSWNVHVVPYPIDTDMFYPESKVSARDHLGLNQEAKIILFGSESGSRDLRKGADLLKSALENHSEIIGPCTLLVFGGQFAFSGNESVTVRQLGSVYDDATLRKVYSASDVLALPSRQDNAPLVGLEALACGIPIVGFRSGGMQYLIGRSERSLLAKPFSAASLASNLKRALAFSETRESYRAWKPANKLSSQNSFKTVGSAFHTLYAALIANAQARR